VIGALRLLLFDILKKLAAFRASIIDEGFHVLLQTRHCVFHLRVEALGAGQAGVEVVVTLVNALVL
jgi:hypothetical protein